MINKVYILTILLIGLLAYSSYGQRASQATMKVSVTVVSGSSVEIEKPELVYVSPQQTTHLGSVDFKGIGEGDVFINSADSIILADKNGNQFRMSISSSRTNEKGANGIRFEGQSDEDMISSVYQGELTTSIEYF